ncbi:Replication factor A protein 1, partial [Quaeritorhiza haematococci]
MTYELTAGAVAAIQAETIHANPALQKPVLQVLNIKKIPAAGTNAERYRIIFSDGLKPLPAMLATQLNGKISGGQIVRHSVVRLTKFLMNEVQGKKITIVLDVDILSDPDPNAPRIGNPMSGSNANEQRQVTFNDGNSDDTNNQSMPPQQFQNQFGGAMNQQQQSPAQFQNQFGGQMNQQQQSHHGNRSMPQQYQNQFGNQQQQTSQGSSNNSGSDRYNSQFSSGRGGGGSSSNMPPRGSDSSSQQNVFGIGGLHPYQNKATILARVASKSEIIHWNNQRGEGRLFTVIFTDQSGEIEAKGFNDAVTKFFDLLQEGHVYYVSNFTIKIGRNKQYSSVRHEYEMTLESGTTITECHDADAVPDVRLDIVKLDRLMDYPKDATIDIMGVVKDTGDVSSLITKTNRQLTKREVTIVDDSNYAVRLTLWGKQAETFDGSSNPVVSVRGAKVSDYGGRALSLYSTSNMRLNPDVPEAHQLRGWYDQAVRGHEDQYGFNTYSNAGGGLSGTQGSRKDPVKTIAQVKTDGLGMGEKPDYFLLKATIMYIKNENAWYPACTSDNCNKKVTEDGTGKWRCERCDITMPNAEFRYIMPISVADHTGQIYVQAFNEIGNQILRRTANELVQLKDDDEEAYKAVFADALFHDVLMKVRAKQENYQDEMKVR